MLTHTTNYVGKKAANLAPKISWTTLLVLSTAFRYVRSMTTVWPLLQKI